MGYVFYRNRGLLFIGGNNCNYDKVQELHEVLICKPFQLVMMMVKSRLETERGWFLLRKV